MFHDKLAPKIRKISRELRTLTSHLDEIARSLHTQEKSKSSQNQTVMACAEIAQAVASGVLEMDALLLAQRNYPTTDVYSAWKARKQAKTVQDKLGRSYIVREMTKSGYSDAQIAAVINCHPKHVYRIRREVMRQPSPFPS